MNQNGHDNPPNKVKTVAIPTPIAAAVKIASVPRAVPLIRWPARISRNEFVMATQELTASRHQ